jgi:hypothetical protein
MRWQTTAALAVILVALAAFYYVYEVRMAPERESADTRKGRVLTVEPADVMQLTIERRDDTVDVKREGDGWQMLAPVKARADRGAVDEVVTTLTTAKSDRQIDPSPTPSALADFGLDKPAARITLTLKDGKRAGVVLGGKNPTGTWVYAREGDKPAILALGDSVLRDATRPVADFRDKTVLAVDRRSVSGLEISTPDDTIVLANADGKWTITRPRQLAADADVVRDFLDKLQAAKVKEFVGESANTLPRWGLDHPTRVTVVTGKDQDRAARTLLFGRVDRDKKGAYAMRQGETSVLLVPDDVWTALPKTVATARDKTVIDVDRDKVAKLELASAKGAVTLVRENARWKIAEPGPLPADQVEVGGVLFKLKDLKAQGFLSDDASGLSRFLAKPDVRVTVTMEGAPPKTLLLASAPERRAGQPSAYAGVAETGPVVLVDAAALNDLARSVNDLRDRTVFYGVEPKEIQRVRLKAGGKSALLERSGDEWKMLEPTRGAAKTQKVDDVVYALRSLRWKEVASPAGQDAAKYGVDQPTFEVSLYRPDGTEIGTLIVGKRETERAYIRTRASPTIYAVDPKLLGDVPKIPDDLKG